MTYDKERYHNLLERLDPKFRAMLDDEETRYPYSVAKIKDELANNLFYIDLPLWCAISLANHLNLHVNNLHFISLIFDHNVSLYKQSVDNGIQEWKEYGVVNGE